MGYLSCRRYVRTLLHKERYNTQSIINGEPITKRSIIAKREEQWTEVSSTLLWMVSFIFLVRTVKTQHRYGKREMQHYISAETR
jgi:hypothetical protein